MKKSYIYQIVLRGSGGVSLEWIKDQEGLVVAHGHGKHILGESIVSENHWSYGLSVETAINCYHNACEMVTAEIEKTEWEMPSITSASSERMRKSMINSINK